MLPFRHPTTMMVAGPTGCGKTQFVVRALTEGMFSPAPQRIVWVYGEWQPAYEFVSRSLRKPKIEFVKDFQDDIYDSLNPTVRNLVILDDQMENREMQTGGGSKLARFFTQGSHHRNLTVIYIVQNVYHQGRGSHTASLNTHYLVLYNNPRDKTQVRTLGTQMYPGKSRFLVDAFADATKKPYGYLVIDLKPDTPDALRVRTNVFDSANTIVYQPASAGLSDCGSDNEEVAVPI